MFVNESGKTILLDRLLTSFVDSYPEKEVLPIRVGFHDLKKGIGTSFKEFMMQRNAEALRIMNYEKVVLLIDDLELSDEKSKTLSIFSKYLEKRDNIRFIATCRENLNHELFFNRNSVDLFKFRRIEIG